MTSPAPWIGGDESPSFGGSEPALASGSAAEFAAQVAVAAAHDVVDEPDDRWRGP